MAQHYEKLGAMPGTELITRTHDLGMVMGLEDARKKFVELFGEL